MPNKEQHVEDMHWRAFCREVGRAIRRWQENEDEDEQQRVA
jgi:hypothetical protein